MTEMETPHWAILILPTVFFYGVRCQEEVEQSLLAHTREGENATILCTYKTANFYSLQWYQQFPGNRPTHLFTLVGKEARKDRHFSADLDKGEKSSRLNIAGVQYGDAATYFCAVDDQNYRFIFGSGTKLHVEPNIEDSEPSVYKLKPRKGDNENLSACLITDYSPGNILAGLNGSLESTSSSFVITSYGASYGTVVWDDKAGNFSCSASHKGKTYSDLTEDADGPPVEEFETDERLNFISITVLGLRVIFLKSVAINLLLTFRLWSC